MALIECPECNKKVSNKARCCVGCGFPINETTYEVAIEKFINISQKAIKDKIEEKIPFFILLKSEIYIAVNLLNDHAGDEIRQLQADGFEIISDDCMARTQEEAIESIKIGFTWWKVWGTLGLLSSLVYMILSMTKGDSVEFMIAFFYVLATFFTLRMNKYAFLLLTAFSLNPLLWLINGIYLKNRWYHSNVNKS